MTKLLNANRTVRAGSYYSNVVGKFKVLERGLRMRGNSGYVSAHRSKRAAEKQAKLFDGGKVIRTPKQLQKILKGKNLEANLTVVGGLR